MRLLLEGDKAEVLEVLSMMSARGHSEEELLSETRQRFARKGMVVKVARVDAKK
jgi:hypothetical protein